MEIQLTQGKVAIIDYRDRGLVAGLTFCAVNKGTVWYATTKINGKQVPLHHIIAGKPEPGFIVDHIDRDGLNNRRRNLRHTTHAVNMRNAKLSKRNTSGYRGVTKDRNRWQAKICVNGVAYYVGWYATAEEAARAYDEASKRLAPGEGYLNFG